MDGLCGGNDRHRLGGRHRWGASAHITQGGYKVESCEVGLSCALLLTGILTVWAADQLRERIVYATFRPANTELYLFDTPGSAPRRLTTDPALDYNPVFSPDGKRLAFVSSRDGNADIYVMPFRPDGAVAPVQAVNLTRHKGGIFTPLSPPTANGWCLPLRGAD